MDLENENKLKDYNLVDIKDLQANLFPLFPKLSGYFSNYLLKSQSEAEDVEENVLRIKPVGSKDLFAINREGNFQIQPARWPTECQVLSEPVDHITSIPPQPEPYYVTTGAEIQPKPSGEEFGIVVYQYCPISAVNYFSRSSVGGSKYLLSTNICPEENSLKFESRFESGNLARAIRLTPNYYELHLRSDLYTSRYMQWFYFRVTNMRKNFLYRFSIVNFTKDGSLYNSGLRPLMYSEKDSQLHSIGWRRCGEQITYFCNENVTEDGEDQQMTYTLTFTVTFPHEGDTVYFASCYPYTYTNLQNYLWELSNHPIKSTYTTLRLLCKSLAGNNVDYITITSSSEEDDVKKKRAIVITARVHPGETPSSWMMKGIIDFLTSDCAPAKELRDKFIFKIVPMLNPDGVVVGNNRCSLSGKDLNRQYRTVMREAYPSIWYTKLMVRRLIEECGVSMYCDLHGHSRKHNIFIYGCENRRQNEKRLQEQIFPLMLHKNASEKFSFEDCSFKVQKGKEGTGRIVMWMMGITNSYTLEASFAGSSLGSRQSTHFSVQDYEQMGKSFCQTLLDFYDAEPRKEQLRMKILNRLCEGGSCADEPTNIQLSDYSSDAGSSSDVEEGGDFNYGYKIKVPPPSPNVPSLNNHPGPNSKFQKKHQNTRSKTNVTKNNLTNRRVAPMRKTNLTLSLSESKFEYCSETSSDSEAENIRPDKDITDGRNRPRNKKIRKKKIQLVTNKFSSIGGRLRNIMDMVTRTWSDLNLLFSKLDDLKVENIKLSERTKILESAIALLDTDEARQETGLTMIRSYFKQNISNRSLEKATEDDNQFYSMKTSRIRADIFKDIDLNDKWLIDYDDSGLIESDEFSDEVSTEFCLPDTMDTIVAVTLEKAMAFNNFLDQLSNSVLPAKQITETYKGEVNQLRSISALEILPPENLNADLRKRSRTPHLKFFSDKRNGLDVDEQLSMVQQRLMALKYKIWYGNGDGDQPISWGNLGNSLVDPAISDKDSKKLVKKKRNNLQRKNTTKGKPKNDVKRKASAKKNVNNLKRQQAIDIQPPVKTIFVRKSQSFNDIASAHSKKPPKLKSYASCDDKESKSDSKTKKTGKLPEKGKNKSFKR